MNSNTIKLALVAVASGFSLLVAAEPTAPIPVKDAAQKARNAEIQAKTRTLVGEQMVRRYRAAVPDGGHVTVDVNLGDPAPVQGWTGRWRMRGSAVVRNYRPMDPRREDEIRSNPKLTIRQIERKIADETYLRSDFVEFDVEVSKLDSEPEIDLTIR